MRKFHTAVVAVVLLFAGPTGAANQAPPLDFSALERAAMEELESTRTPGGAIAIVVGDRVVYSKGFGVASVETNEPVRPETLFRLGSTTKMFTAAALISLAEQGKLDLNAPVGSYVTGLDAKVGRVTASQLLSHQSGFFDEAPMFGSNDETALEKEVRSWSETRFFTEPGRIFSYSNPGYWFAGFLIEHASKKKYADQLAESIFAPLGMKRTTLRPLVAMTHPLAQGHDETPPRVIRPAANNAASWPAGSIFSNVNDLSRFVIAFLNDGQIDGRQVLSPAVIRALSASRARIPGSDAYYGYGLQISKNRGVDVVSHGGSRAGYGSSIRMVPSKKFGVIAVANRTGVSLSTTLETAMEIGLAGTSVTGGVEVSGSSHATPASLDAYVGTYSQGPRTIEILVRDGALILKQNNREQPISIYDDRPAAVAGRWIAVRNASGAVEYLHSGSRSWRKVQ